LAYLISTVGRAKTTCSETALRPNVLRQNGSAETAAPNCPASDGQERGGTKEKEYLRTDELKNEFKTYRETKQTTIKLK